MIILLFTAMLLSFRPGPAASADRQSEHDYDDDTRKPRRHNDRREGRRLRHDRSRRPIHTPAAPADDNNDNNKCTIQRCLDDVATPADHYRSDVIAGSWRPARSATTSVDVLDAIGRLPPARQRETGASR